MAIVINIVKQDYVDVYVKTIVMVLYISNLVITINVKDEDLYILLLLVMQLDNSKDETRMAKDLIEIVVIEMVKIHS